ncbi:MAG: hypothetical protein RIA71_05160 [Oceanicaulis sp.]
MALRARLGSAIAAGAVFALTACAPEGRAPDRIEIGEERHPVYHLTSLSDPYGDLFVAPDQGVFIDFGRTEAIVSCERRGYTCVQWPFVFSFPDEGDPPAGGWQAAGYDFRVVAETERNFCGRTRTAYLVEGANETGWATRVWYNPDFGVYAVMSGQAFEGQLMNVERAYTTCQRGLFKRQGRIAALSEASAG